MMLAAFAAEQGRLQQIVIVAGAQQQTSLMPLLLSIDGTDGWVDGYPAIS